MRMRHTHPVAGLLFLITAAHADPVTDMTLKRNISPDGRFRTQCYDRGLSRTSSELCTLSFYRLLARPEDYHNRNIAVVGLLASYAGQTALFANRESFKAGITENGILIGAEIPPKLQKELKTGIWPVMVSGVFDARCW